MRHLPPRLAARLLPRARRCLSRDASRRSPDSRCSRMMLQGDPAFCVGSTGSRGARPGGNPGPFDRCLLLTDSVFRDDSPSLDARPIAFPPKEDSHAIREPAVSRRVAHFGEPTDVLERVLLQAPSRRRASDTSSPGGLPWRSCVHQRRPAIALATSGRTRRPRPRSPSRVNGLWLR